MDQGKTLYVNGFIKNIIKKGNLYHALEGFARTHGYNFQTIKECPTKISHLDILIIWNRHMAQDAWAKRFEMIGAKVIVFENPYISMNSDWFSVGLSYHNNFYKAIKTRDSGERWNSFGITTAPWKTKGKYILVCTQAKNFNGSGLGHSDYRQPDGWDSYIIKQIRTRTDMPIMFRAHPRGYPNPAMVESVSNGVSLSDGSKVSIQDDLINAYCTVLHSSNAATESLLAGVPVCMTGQSVFSQPACNIGLKNINNLNRPDSREEIFHRMSWNQYHVSEIESGLMFSKIIDNL